VFQSKAVVLGLLVAFSFLVIPKEGLAQAKMGSMTGFIFGADQKTPVESAVVKVRNVADGREYQSMPTDRNGLYAVKNLPAGRYSLGVSGTKGDFNFDYELQIKGGELAKLAVALVPVTAKAQDEDQQKKKKAFFLTPLGIATLVAAGGLLIYGGIQLFGEGETSPSKR
jgi:hypothetical protein